MPVIGGPGPGWARSTAHSIRNLHRQRPRLVSRPGMAGFRSSTASGGDTMFSGSRRIGGSWRCSRRTLRWQGGSIYRLMSRVQHRPEPQQASWRFYPSGRAVADTLADDDSESPHRRGKLASACRPRAAPGLSMRPGCRSGRSSRSAPSGPPVGPARFQGDDEGPVLRGRRTLWPALSSRDSDCK
jgi:hypothetical protein